MRLVLAGLEQVRRRYLKLWADMPLNLVPAENGLWSWGDTMDVVSFLGAVVTDWQAVFATLQDLDAKVMRCDLAVDFLEGELAIDDIERMYDAGEFHCGGGIPDYRKIESVRGGVRLQGHNVRDRPA